MKHVSDYKLQYQGKSSLSSSQLRPHKIFTLIFSFMRTISASFSIQYHAVTVLFYVSYGKSIIFLDIKCIVKHFPIVFQMKSSYE